MDLASADAQVSDPEEEQEQVRKVAWYRHQRTLAVLVLNTLSVLALAAGGFLASQVRALVALV